MKTKTVHTKIYVLLFISFLFIGIFLCCSKNDPAPEENSFPWQIKQISDFTPPANAIYIDPSATQNGSGTQASPLNGSAFQIQFGQPWKDSATYLFKAGSIFHSKYGIAIQANNVTLGAYGTGAKPIIQLVSSKNNVISISHSSGVVIRDLELFSDDIATSGVGYMYDVGGAVINCKIHNCVWGIRNLTSTEKFRVINCEVFYTGDDGIFISNVDSLEFAGNNVHHVNRKYFVNQNESYSGGDGLQMLNIKAFYIHDNTIDHSGTGNKFCLIINTDQSGFSGKGIIERNLFKRDQTFNIFYSNYEDNINMIIRYNKFMNAEEAIQNRSKNLQVYYNEFINITKTAYDGSGSKSSNSKIFNNTFYNVKDAVNSNGEVINVKNNIFYKCTGTAILGGSGINLDYNCYYLVNENGTKDIGSHSINMDPKFKNEPASDFQLQNGSPCIDKGDEILGTYKDIYGNTVPNGSAPDIGAHEYH